MTSILESITTETTCSDACWYAREDVCRCSCGGANHGCLNVAGREQPARTCRIKGVRYVLTAIGTYSEISKQRYAIEREAYRAADYWRQPEAAVMKRATAAQTAGWSEINTITARDWKRPYLLWVREAQS